MAGKLLGIDVAQLGGFAGGGAIAGILSYEVGNYAKEVKTGSTKENIPFIADKPYITGLLVALGGFALASYGGKKNQAMMQNLGFGLFAGGLASALIDLMPTFGKTTTAAGG